MKKLNLLQNSLYAVLCVCMLWSCAEKRDYQTAIPADSKIVMKVNPGAMFAKTELADNDTFNSLMMTLRGTIGLALKDAPLKELATKTLDDPSALGIDLGKPIIFCLSDATVSMDEARPVMILAVSDMNKLKDAIETLSGTLNVETDASGCAGRIGKDGTLLPYAFNETAFVAGTPSLSTDYLTALLDQNRIAVESPYFEEFVSSTDDIAVYSGVQAYMDILTSVPGFDENVRQQIDKTDIYKDMYFLMTTNSDKGVMYLRARSFGTPDSLKTVNINVSGLLERLPQSTSAALALKMKTTPEYDRATFENLNEETLQEINGNLEELGIGIDDIIYAIKNGIVAGLDGDISFSETPKYSVSVAAMPETAQKIRDILNEEIENADVSFDGKFLTLTNMEKGYTKTFANSPMAGIISQYGGFIFDFSRISLPVNGKNSQIAEKVLDMFEYMTIVPSEENDDCSFSITFKNKQDNALKTVSNTVIGLVTGK